MRRKRRTEVTIETHRVLVIHRSRGVVRAWCEGCGEPVRMVTPDEAAAMAGVTARTIYRWVEAEKLHFTEPPEGSLLICLRSLPKAT